MLCPEIRRQSAGGCAGRIHISLFGSNKYVVCTWCMTYAVLDCALLTRCSKNVVYKNSSDMFVGSSGFDQSCALLLRLPENDRRNGKHGGQGGSYGGNKGRIPYKHFTAPQRHTPYSYTGYIQTNCAALTVRRRACLSFLSDRYSVPQTAAAAAAPDDNATHPKSSSNTAVQQESARGIPQTHGAERVNS